MQQGDCLLLRTQIPPLENTGSLEFDDYKILPRDRDFYDSSTHKEAQTISLGNPWMQLVKSHKSTLYIAILGLQTKTVLKILLQQGCLRTFYHQNSLSD